MVVAVGAALYASLQSALLGGTVIVFNDDFGYLRSVVETANRGRPWTDDWLEPWSGSFATFSAVVWRATGSFRIATQGVQLVLLMIAFIAAVVLLRRRGVACWASVAVSGLILTTPTLLAKNLEYTGFVLSLPCLMLALLAAESRRWAWFTIVTGFATATRQSAIAWFAIPAAAALFNLVCDRRAVASTFRALAACGVGAAFFAFCNWGMNRTHAQAVITAHMWDSLTLSSAARVAGEAVMVSLACIGLGNIFAALFSSRRRWSDVTHRSRLILQALAALVLVLLLINRRFFELQFEHTLFTTWFGRTYIVIAALLGIAGGWSRL